MFIFGKKKASVQNVLQTVQNHDQTQAQQGRMPTIEEMFDELNVHRERILELERILCSKFSAVGTLTFREQSEEFQSMPIGQFIPTEDVQTESRSAVHHRGNAVHQQGKASRRHDEIIDLRNETPPAAFRKIADDLKLPLSSVQSEVRKHAIGKCSCFA